MHRVRSRPTDDDVFLSIVPVAVEHHAGLLIILYTIYYYYHTVSLHNNCTAAHTRRSALSHTRAHSPIAPLMRGGGWGGMARIQRIQDMVYEYETSCPSKHLCGCLTMGKNVNPSIIGNRLDTSNQARPHKPLILTLPKFGRNCP